MSEEMLKRKVSLPILHAMVSMPQENDSTEVTIQADVIQTISFLAQKEIERIKKHQSDGIAAAKAKGIRFGRPVKELPENFPALVKQWEQGKLRTKDFMIQTGLTESTLYRRLRECNAMKLHK